MNDAEIRAKVSVDDDGGFIRIGNNIKKCGKQVDFLKVKIDDIKDKLHKADMGFEVGDTMKLESDLEKLQNQYSKLTGVSENTTAKMSKGLKGVTKNAGRFVFNMFAVGSVFALVARAGRSYMETNEDARASMEITSNVMGQMLAPAMKTIINLTQYAIIGIAELIRLFTGYDALTKATTKNIKKASGATKELNKQLSGLDEITNIGDNTNIGGLTTGLEADLNALDNFQSKIKEVRDWMDKNKNAIEIVGTTLLSVFGAVTILKVMNGISSFMGVAGSGLAVGTGLAGLAALLIFVSSVAIITITVNGAKEVNDALDSVTAHAKTNTDTAQKMVDKTKEFWDNGKLTQSQKENYITSIKDMIKSNNDLIKDLESKKNWFTLITGGNKKIDDSIEEVQKQSDLLKDSFEKLTGQKYNVNLEAKIDTKQPQSFFDKLKSAFSNFGLGMLSFPKFASGNVASTPTFGMFGEYAGAKNNPEITTPQSIMYDTVMSALANGNGITNELLSELIDKVDQIEINPYTTIKDVGKASVNYINNQKRIMGEDVI